MRHKIGTQSILKSQKWGSLPGNLPTMPKYEVPSPGPSPRFWHTLIDEWSVSKHHLQHITLHSTLGKLDKIYMCQWSRGMHALLIHKFLQIINGVPFYIYTRLQQMKLFSRVTLTGRFDNFYPRIKTIEAVPFNHTPHLEDTPNDKVQKTDQALTDFTCKPVKMVLIHIHRAA